MRYFKIDLSTSLHYCACGNLLSRNHFLHHRRTFDQNVLIVVLTGTLHISQAGQPFCVEAGQYLLLRAGEEHFGLMPSEGELSYLWVHFTGQTPLELTDGSITADSCVIPEYSQIAATQCAVLLFRQLLDFSLRSELHYPQIADHALNLLILELAQEYLDAAYHKTEQIPPVLSSIFHWIRANCQQPVSIQDIAIQFGYNPNYLSALFKKHTGFSLIQYLNKTRIEVSKNLLANNLITIKEAAYSSGFSDEKYYMKMFKKYEGITPSQYKNAFH